MRGYVVDSHDRAITFRIKDPTTKEVNTSFMLVRGGAVSMIPATPGQINPDSVQYQHTPDATPRVGILAPEIMAAAEALVAAQGREGVENGVIVPDQSLPTGTVPEPTEEEAERLGVLSRGAAADL